MLASRRWRDWKPPQEFPKEPEHQPTEPTKPAFVSFDGSPFAQSQIMEAQPVSYRHGLEAWRESIAEWLETECTRHWRCHSSVTSLHQAYSEWDVSHGFPRCNRETFMRLLQEAGFLIPGETVSGLILRADLEGLCGYPEYARLFAEVRSSRRSEFLQ